MKDKNGKKPSYKETGIVFTVILLFILVVVISISNVSCSKVQKTKTKVSVAKSESNTASSSSNTDSLVLSRSIDLESVGDEVQCNGVIYSKSVYRLGGQTVYCINLVVDIDGKQKIFAYVCSYSVYSSVESSDILSVVYQPLKDDSYRLVSVSKQSDIR